MRGLLAEIGAAFTAMFAAPVARAAEWQRIEAELIAVTGSRHAALSMAQCAVVAAKAGVQSPDEMAGLIRRAVIRHNDMTRIQYRLRSLISEIEDMEES